MVLVFAKGSEDLFRFLPFTGSLRTSSLSGVLDVFDMGRESEGGCADGYLRVVEPLA